MLFCAVGCTIQVNVELFLAPPAIQRKVPQNSVLVYICLCFLPAFGAGYRLRLHSVTLRKLLTNRLVVCYTLYVQRGRSRCTAFSSPCFPFAPFRVSGTILYYNICYPLSIAKSNICYFCINAQIYNCNLVYFVVVNNLILDNNCYIIISEVISWKLKKY